MAKIFISFIHEDENVAEAVQRFLRDTVRSSGSAFLSSDKWQVFAGENWLERIRQELKEAQVVILMLSKASVSRPWVNFEAGAAWLTDKWIIPVCFGGLSKKDLPKPYSSIQALDLVEEPYYLVTSVCHHLGCLSPPPPLPPALSPGDTSYEPYQRLLDAVDNFEKSMDEAR